MHIYKPAATHACRRRGSECICCSGQASKCKNSCRPHLATMRGVAHLSALTWRLGGSSRHEHEGKRGSDHDGGTRDEFAVMVEYSFPFMLMAAGPPQPPCQGTQICDPFHGRMHVPFGCFFIFIAEAAEAAPQGGRPSIACTRWLRVSCLAAILAGARRPPTTQMLVLVPRHWWLSEQRQCA